MSHRFSRAAKWLIIMLFVTSVSGNVAVAQQGTNNQGQQIMTPVSFPNDYLHLREFEAAAGDLSSCAGDSYCLNHAREIKSWSCAEALCQGTVKSKSPITCFKKLAEKYPVLVQEQIDESICPLLNSPGIEIRSKFLTHFPNETNDDLVEIAAYLLALKGSWGSCQDSIKNYVGAYGPKWNNEWYRALSGCRILAKKRTLQEEDNDFFVWSGGNCADEPAQHGKIPQKLQPGVFQSLTTQGMEGWAGRPP